MAKGAFKFKHRKKTRSKLPAAVILGRRGGVVGGPARARALTPERRRAIAAMGGRSRSRGSGRGE